MPVGLITRAREIDFKHPTGKLRSVDNYTGQVYLNQSFDATISGRQVTASEGHAFPGKPGKLRDLGGPFRTQKNRVLYGGNTALHTYALSNKDYYGNTVTYTGAVFPVPALKDAKGRIFGDLFPPSYESSDIQLAALGTTAIARCKPTNSIASLSVTLAELKREGIPQLIGSQFWKSRAKSLREKSRAAGGEYLNYQFGWAPLISDVNKAITAARTADKVLEQFRRDSGRVVRRRYEFPTTKVNEDPVTSSMVGLGYAPGSPLNSGLSSASDQRYDLVRSRTVEQRRWFSGAFTYHLPIGSDTEQRIMRSASEARKLYGLSIDPEVIWNLLPWSWAVDWALNIGDVLSNASDAMTDGLVMPYGYMMEHTIVTDTYSADLKQAGVGHTSISFVTETKKRVQASPYGFGLTWDSFSPYQISIMAALGISRR